MTIEKKRVYARPILRKILGIRSFGDKLNSYRLSRDYSQVQMAAILGISKQELCNIEKGRKLVSVERAVTFAKHLEMSPHMFAKYALQDQLRRAGIPGEITIKYVA